MAREVKFQLSSTLTGMGTANLGALFDGYQVGRTSCWSRRVSGSCQEG